MSKHNYSQYSKKNVDNENKVVEELNPIQPVEIIVDEPVAEVKMEPEVAVVKETVETVTLPKAVTGTVFNCSKLNVRSKPSTDAEVVAVLDNNSEVEIDSARSTNEWLKITTAVGVDGFCMRKFVNAKL